MIDYTSVNDALEAAKKISPVNGGEYWMARDIQPILGYDTWENFQGVIEKARLAIESTKTDSMNHIRSSTKMVSIGSGAMRKRADFFLSRYGSYLVAMNGDPSKPQIGAAQTYFAVQTRLRELDVKVLEAQERLRLRGMVTEATKDLNSVASRAGVQNYALFHHAGYLGLYDMGLKDIKRHKGIPDDEALYDRVGGLELSANEFKAQLTKQAIISKKIRGQSQAEQEHKRMGRVVRETVRREAGVNPENLPAEPSIKRLAAKTKSKSLPPSKSGSV